ncbi:hypothetical protein [Marisediminicola sp. LYQ134]|uniref:hypothetical protein n=1 Tax=Marisediminicola sp. LYQ134 TaxID=3391061 RepID=UPI0039832691
MATNKEKRRAYMREYRARKRREAAEPTPPKQAENVLPPPTDFKRPPPGPHRKAVTRMLKSTGLAHVPEEAPLIELLRDLADEMDRNPSPRLTTQYRGTLKDVRAVLKYAPGRPQSSPETKPKAAPEEPVDPEEVEATVSSLAAFRTAHGIGA